MARAVESDAPPRRRFYRQSPGERWWFAVILLPVLLTAAFVVTSGAAVEQDLELRTAEALHSNGLSGVVVEMSGRNATLQVPTGQSEEKAVEAAEGVEGIGNVKAVNVARSAAEARACERLEETLGAEDEILTFAGSSTSLSGSAASSVASIAKLLVKCPGATVKTEGHTDGSVLNSSVVSLRRAEAVCAALAREGVAAVRCSPQGYGDTQPASVDNSAAARELNNRVAITLEEE